MVPPKIEVAVKRILKIFNILLVDDTWANLMAIQNQSKRIKIKDVTIVISTCIDGEKAVEKFEETNK